MALNLTMDRRQTRGQYPAPPPQQLLDLMQGCSGGGETGSMAAKKSRIVLGMIPPLSGQKPKCQR